MSVSRKFTLYGDFDGYTVGQIKEMLSEYPDDAEISVDTEQVDHVHRYAEEEYFQIIVKD